jgi:type VI protein secretion system component VasF
MAVHQPELVCWIPQNKEDAQLIAAAPDLLEAAVALKDACNRPSAARTRAEAWRALDKAIAKAARVQP